MSRWLVVLAMLATAAAPLAQVRRFGGGYGPPILRNPEYNGRFTFVRLRYGDDVRFATLPWSHDYPVGERNFLRILDELSILKPRVLETSVLGLDDPELFRFPIAYMAEPGFWMPTETEAAHFRSYLLKGGFVIFDDFSAARGGWNAFEQAFRRAMPDVRFFDLDASHPIFHSFFEIDSLDILPNDYDYGDPVLRAVFEDNDPTKRMLAMINFNTDISEYWEAPAGFAPVDETNQAYKLGINYVMYGLTH
jgi:hypothetical protein